MYIPKEILGFLLGFCSFPAFCYLVYKLKGWDKEEKKDDNR